MNGSDEAGCTSTLVDWFRTKNTYMGL